MKHSLLLTICLFLTGCASSSAITRYTPQQGDILFQSLPHIPVIDAIEGCTHSPYSHCGIVVNKGGTWHVLEAIGPVKITRLDHWISQGRGEAFAAYRLKAAFQPKVGAMIAAAEKFIGLPYDIGREWMLDAGRWAEHRTWKSGLPVISHPATASAAPRGGSGPCLCCRGSIGSSRCGSRSSCT